MLFNRAMKSLYYANRGIPKSISILLIALGCMNTNQFAYIWIYIFASQNRYYYLPRFAFQ